MNDDNRIEIEVAIDRWRLNYVWGIGEPVDSPVLPEHMHHGPQFLNALELEILGTARLDEPEDRDVPASVRMPEIDGPEPSAHDAEQGREFVGCGHGELRTSLQVVTGLTRGALLAVHYTLSQAKTPRISLLCSSFELTGLDKKHRRCEVIRFSVGPSWPD